MPSLHSVIFVALGGALGSVSRYLLIGILGGFTTFSSFGNDTINLLRDGETFNALANVGANVIAGLALVWLGRMAAHWIWR